MAGEYTEIVETARDYYNSEDADNFYFHIWGGNDIHIGLYQHGQETIADASRQTIKKMAEHLPVLDTDSRVLDIGSGYCGAARNLADKFGCHVTALNLSEAENERARMMNRDVDLDHLIDVIDGSFESIPCEDESFDVVWSQDAILHSGRREKVISEVARVLKPGGSFIFTDPMQADNCPPGVLQPVLDRIHLESLGSPGFYTRACRANGLKLIHFSDYTEQLGRHYQRVYDVLADNKDDLKGKVSKEYITRMLKGLKHWVEACDKGYLSWGILQYKKVQ